MAHVYITSTLKNEWNKQYNPQLCQVIEEAGISCYLPQRDTNQIGSGEEKCKTNFAAIDESDVIVCVAENESINWGAEVGYASAAGKHIVAVMREGHELPVMCITLVHVCITVPDLDDIMAYSKKLIAAIQKQS